MIKIDVDKKSIGYKQLMALWWADQAQNKKILDFVKYYFFDDFKIVANKDGFPQYVQSSTIPEDSWVSVEDGYAPVKPPKVWQKAFPWHNDAVSKIIVGKGIYLAVGEKKIIRGFLVLVDGEEITIKCDPLILKYFNLKDGFSYNK